MNTEELLRENAPIVREALLASLPAPEDCDHQFSHAFERKMRRLLRRQAHPLRHQVMRRAAALFLASLLGATSWLAVDTNARAAFFHWVQEFYETHIVYRFMGEPAEETAVYRLGWVPEGYEEVNAWEGVIIFVNESGDNLSFTYGPIQDGAYRNVIDSDNATIYQVDINGISGEFYLYSDPTISNTLIWIDTNNGIHFSISGFFEESDMLHMGKNVFLDNSTKT